MTTNNLTEKRKRRELKEGFYYTKIDIGGGDFISITEYYDDHFINYPEQELEEVLAPVPSWEQWQQMKAFCEEFNALNVAEENQRL